MHPTKLLLLSLVVGVGGCSGISDEGGSTSESTRAVSTDNGVSLNGIQFNGIQFNGRQFNGRQFNGIQFNGIQFNGIQFNGRQFNGTLEGTMLVGTIDGTRIQGADFVGATMTGVLDNGATITIRVDAFAQNPNPANADMYLYTLSVRDDRNTWTPMCGRDSSGRAIAGTAFEGRWDQREGVTGGGSKLADSDLFTFACARSVIFECADIGYKPWKTLDGISLENHHQACTRMMRADYCGNGTPYTVDGMLINVYDGLGIQFDTERWHFEAEWSTGGAVCLKQPRRVNKNDVPCRRELERRSCGDRDHFEDDTLLMSESDNDNDNDDD